MFHTIEEAIQDLKKGKPIIVVDDEDRENEGDLVALSEYITPEIINFMISHGKGLVCTTITKELAEKLQLNAMTNDNTDPYGTAFTVSIDHETTTTGISAYERAKTIIEMTKPTTSPGDFKRPGHVFPLVARPGGLLKRPRHSYASVDVGILSNAFQSATIYEIVKEDGDMARVADLFEMSKHFDLSIITIKALQEFRYLYETQITREVETTLPTTYGSFNVIGYTNLLD